MSDLQVEYASVPGFSIAKASLSPPEIELEKMNDFMQKLQERSDESNKQFWDQTGGMAHLHKLMPFDWLTIEVEKLVVRYLLDLGYDTTRISLFHQKSWPVITRKDGAIKRHAHFNSVLAAVFYLRCYEDSGGHLVFHMDRPSLPNIPKINLEKIEFPALITKIVPQSFDLLVFPAGLPHSVTVYEGESPRWSIAYDISVTASEKLGSGNTESVVIHPSFWREFCRD